jgi:histidinol phosphatase-like enzyme
MVGDMLSDMLAGRNAGCRGSILVRTGEPEELAAAERYADYVVDDLPAAASWILSQTGSTAAPQSFAHRDSSLRKGTPSP